MAYKMKGYSYPGKSPLREDTKSEVKIQPKKSSSSYNIDWNNSNTVHEAPPSKPQEKPKYTSKNRKTGEEVEIKVDANLAGRQESAAAAVARKAKRRQYLGNLGEQAAMALITGGINAGINALTRSKKKKPRRGADTSGFTSINFGRK